MAMSENEAISMLEQGDKNANEADCTYEEYLEAIEMGRKALEEIQEYRAIGTIEEFKALKERSESKAVVKYENGYKCPVCNHWVGYRYGYCDGCGQKLDWSEEGGAT